MVVVASELAIAGEEPDLDAAGDRAPIGDLEDAVLRFSGVARLTVGGARIRDLYRATFHGRRPVVSVDRSGVLSIQYQGRPWWPTRNVAAELTLTSAVSWAIEKDG